MAYYNIKITIFSFSFFLWSFAHGQSVYRINRYEDDISDLNTKGYNTKNYSNTNIHLPRISKKYIGDRMIIGGIGVVCVVGFIAYATGSPPQTNPTISSSRLTYKQKCELADFGWFGFGSLVIGGYLEFSNFREEDKRRQKFSLIGNRNQFGIAYNLK